MDFGQPSPVVPALRAEVVDTSGIVSAALASPKLEYQPLHLGGSHMRWINFGCKLLKVELSQTTGV